MAQESLVHEPNIEAPATPYVYLKRPVLPEEFPPNVMFDQGFIDIIGAYEGLRRAIKPSATIARGRDFEGYDPKQDADKYVDLRKGVPKRVYGHTTVADTVATRHGVAVIMHVNNSTSDRLGRDRSTLLKGLGLPDVERWEGHHFHVSVAFGRSPLEARKCKNDLNEYLSEETEEDVQRKRSPLALGHLSLKVR